MKRNTKAQGGEIGETLVTVFLIMIGLMVSLMFLYGAGGAEGAEIAEVKEEQIRTADVLNTMMLMTDENGTTYSQLIEAHVVGDEEEGKIRPAIQDWLTRVFFDEYNFSVKYDGSTYLQMGYGIPDELEKSPVTDKVTLPTKDKKKATVELITWHVE